MATQTLTPPSGVAQTYNPQTGIWGDFNAPSNGVSPLSSSYNPGTNAGGSTTKSLTNPGSVSGSVPDTGSALSSTLNSDFAPTQNTIMQNYAAANSAIANKASATEQTIKDTGNYNLGYENTQDKNLGTQQLEGRSGFVTNPGAIVALQTQADKRVRDLTTQMNDALANNNASLASSLASNVAAEQSAITNARTAFLSQYFGAQQEARSEASFPLQQQQSIADIANSVAQGKLTQAQAQVTLKQMGLTDAQIQQTLASAGLSSAQAGLAGAQTTQTKTLTNMISGGVNEAQDILDLRSGKLTPQSLQDKYAQYGQYSPAAKILSDAQAQGYNVQQATLTGQAQTAQNNALNSGNPFTLLGGGLTQGLGALGSALGGSGSVLNNTIGGMNSLSSSPPKGTDGTSYGFPGYVSNGTAWVKK